ncbi:MAG: transglycosylase domain-containing protein, partial [Aminipila sp.]
MSDDFNKKNNEDNDKLRKIDEFFSQFEETTNGIPIESPKNVEEFLSRFNELEQQQKQEKEELEERRKTRMDRLNEKKTKSKPSIGFKRTNSNDSNNEEKDMANSTTKKTKKHKYRLNPKKFLLFLLGIFIVCGIAGGAYLITIFANAPEIDRNNIYSLLSESSVLYDDEGNVIDTLSASGKTRTNIEYKDLPQDVIDAFVALEDKTFWKHHGFNFIRILGAIKESIFSGGNISGTSTITQQLARNLYLTESMSKYSYERKIKEACYTVLLEKNLTKEEIIEAYLNTIYLGHNAYGIQAASEAYFSKDVNELDLLESAALAALPQAPHSYALIKRIEPEDITNPEDKDILFKDDQFYYVFNDISKKRREMCLQFMNEQEYISNAEKEEALSDDLKAHMNPGKTGSSNISSYFSDFVISQVRDQLMEELNISADDANQKIYTNGLQIYTTLNSGMQKIAETEFANNKNFPNVANLKKDGNQNIVNDSGSIMLYSYNTYFNSEGSFILQPSEFKKNSDGSLTIYKGKRLNIYNTEYNDIVDYNLEFKPMYLIEDGVFYNIKNGVVTIPAEYKTKDSAGNLNISADLLDKYPSMFKSNGDTLVLSPDYYTLSQKVVQPQSAMVISDPYTGSVKALVGGRNTVGRQLFNRAVKPRQPGSSIKPIGVYAPALQASADAVNSGTKMNFSDSTGVSSLFGNYFTAASVIDDTPLTVQGKQWPKNWYTGYRGLYTLRASIEQSVNVNAVRVFQQLGVPKSVSFLKSVGVSTIVESGATNDLNAAALALGGMSKGISPLEMSAAYSTFVNDGKYSEPITFTKVLNKRGEVLIENTPKSTQVMDPGVAFLMRDMLRSTVTHGLGSKAAIPNQPVAGKTGTTTDNCDAWFVGFTPQYSAAVWIGNDINIELSQGSASAARLWSNIMGKVCAKLPTGTYNPAPSNIISVTVDTKSGKLPSSLSSQDPRGTVRSEYFIKGTQPTSTDDIHSYVTVCAESGYLATPLCSSTKSVLGVKRPYRVNPAVGDISYEVPHYYCNLHNPDPSKYAVNPSGNPNYNFNGVQQPTTTPETGTDTTTPDGNANNNHGGNSNNGGNTNNGGGNTNNGGGT